MDEAVCAGVIPLQDHPSATIAPAERDRLADQMEQLWEDFCGRIMPHFSYREAARRTWRDGECFLRLYPQEQWPPTVRFIDPECVAGTRDESSQDGIRTAADDVEQVDTVRIDPARGEWIETIPVSEMLHIKCNADTNERRGNSIFRPVLSMLQRYERWLDTELQARTLQASIVLWRRIQGGPGSASSLTEEQTSGVGEGRKRSISAWFDHNDIRWNRVAVPATDHEFSGRGFTRAISSTVHRSGNWLARHHADIRRLEWEFCIHDGRRRSGSLKLFESEQLFFATAFERLWLWVMQEAERMWSTTCGHHKVDACAMVVSTVGES